MYLLISIIASYQVQILMAQYDHSGDPQFNNDPPSNNELAANAGSEFHDDNRPFEDTFDDDLPSNDELAANAGSEFQEDNRSLEDTFDEDLPSNDALAANAGSEFQDDSRPFENTFDENLPSNDALAAYAGSEFQDDSRPSENTFDEDLPTNDALAANAGSEFLDDTPYTMIPTLCPVDCKDSLVYPRSGTLVLCKDGSSNSTVYGGPGTCKSNCRWSNAEGFSYCDTFHLFWRDNRWYDWDLCSLCEPHKDKDSLTRLTPHGNECEDPTVKKPNNPPDYKCTRAWNNYEYDGPRCRTTAGTLDYCSTCLKDHPEQDNPDKEHSFCPVYKEDKRKGSEVNMNYGLWVVPSE